MSKMDEKTTKRIAEEFNITEDSVSEMVVLYEKIKEDIQGQYLAHLVRALEASMRILTKNELFRVIVCPASLNDIKMGKSKAVYTKNCLFRIGYPKEWDDKKKRVYIAHELGHLYLLSQKQKTGIRRFDDQTEPLATIFGMLAILDRDEFYSSVADKGLIHSDFDELINSFKQI